MTDPIPWLPPLADGTDGDATDDPWAEVDLPEVALSDEQQGFLASFAEQPRIPRLSDMDDPLARFEGTGLDPAPFDPVPFDPVPVYPDEPEEGPPEDR